MVKKNQNNLPYMGPILLTCPNVFHSKSDTAVDASNVFNV